MRDQPLGEEHARLVVAHFAVELLNSILRVSVTRREAFRIASGAAVGGSNQGYPGSGLTREAAGDTCALTSVRMAPHVPVRLFTP